MKANLQKLLLVLTIMGTTGSYSFSQSSDPYKTPIDTIRSIDDFRALTEPMLNHSSVKGSKIGISVYSLRERRYLFNHNAEESLVPASVTKLFTSFFAFKQMGAEGTINTTVYTDANEIKANLEGNIYLVGRGDAHLSLSDLEHIASQIKALGIKTISGNIYADGSYFDNNMYRFHYSGDKDEVEYVPPVSALSIEKNTASVIVSAGSVAGRPVNVQVLPTSMGFVTNVSATVRGGAARSKGNILYPEIINNDIYYDFNPNIQNYGDANSDLAQRRTARSSINVTSSTEASGKQVINVSGTLSPNSNVRRYLPLSSPDIIVAGALQQRMLVEGITIKGNLLRKSISSLPADTNLKVIAEFRRPLKSILNVVNKNSDNYLAENIFKMIGANAGNSQNNKVGANDYYRMMFDSLRFPDDEFLFNDGSGLSRRNKVSAETISYLLELASEYSFANVYASSMSIAAVDGTLRRRFADTPAAGNLLGKTGTLRNVSALAGYVNTLDGDTLCFAIISNGWAVAQYKLLENRLGTMMSYLLLDVEYLGR